MSKINPESYDDDVIEIAESLYGLDDETSMACSTFLVLRTICYLQEMSKIREGKEAVYQSVIFQIMETLIEACHKIPELNPEQFYDYMIERQEMRVNDINEQLYDAWKEDQNDLSNSHD